MYFAEGFVLWLPSCLYLFYVGPSSQKIYTKSCSTQKSSHNSDHPYCPGFVQIFSLLKKLRGGCKLFSAMYNPLQHQKTKDFMMFSGGIETEK